MLASSANTEQQTQQMPSSCGQKAARFVLISYLVLNVPPLFVFIATTSSVGKELFKGTFLEHPRAAANVVVQDDDDDDEEEQRQRPPAPEGRRPPAAPGPNGVLMMPNGMSLEDLTTDDMCKDAFAAVRSKSRCFRSTLGESGRDLMLSRHQVLIDAMQAPRSSALVHPKLVPAKRFLSKCMSRRGRVMPPLTDEINRIFGEHITALHAADDVKSVLGVLGTMQRSGLANAGPFIVSTTMDNRPSSPKTVLAVMAPTNCMHHLRDDSSLFDLLPAKHYTIESKHLSSQLMKCCHNTRHEQKLMVKLKHLSRHISLDMSEYVSAFVGEDIISADTEIFVDIGYLGCAADAISASVQALRLVVLASSVLPMVLLNRNGSDIVDWLAEADTMTRLFSPSMSSLAAACDHPIDQEAINKLFQMYQSRYLCVVAAETMFAREITYVLSESSLSLRSEVSEYMRWLFPELQKEMIAGIKSGSLGLWITNGDDDDDDKAVVKEAAIKRVDDVIAIFSDSYDLQIEDNIADEWRNKRLSPFEMFCRHHQRAIAQQLNRVGQPFDRKQHLTESGYYLLTSNTANIHYLTIAHAIFLPLGMHHLKFFPSAATSNADICLVELLASVGVVVGHELAHAVYNRRQANLSFDSKDWPPTQASTNRAIAYEEAAMRVYSNLHKQKFGWWTRSRFGEWPTESSVGTVDENIADIIGVHLAHRLLMKAVHELGEAHVGHLKGMTSEQTFFVLYAMFWSRCECGMKEDASFGKFAKHSPFWLRVLGPLSFSTNFKNAFQCSSVIRKYQVE